MKFADIDGQRVEASPGALGVCRGCGAQAIAKCGEHVMWHWAHKPRTHCDHWWEAETPWHRAWKDRFLLEWQEAILLDEETGERHVADVRTAAGLVIEFQRSSIHPDEVKAREAFYRRMIWIVDGTRSNADKFNFSNMRSGLDDAGRVSFVWHGRSTLFERWHSSKPVFIDFGEAHGFWRILRYDKKARKGMAAIVDIAAFVALASSGSTDFSAGGGPAST